MAVWSFIFSAFIVTYLNILPALSGPTAESYQGSSTQDLQNTPRHLKLTKIPRSDGKPSKLSSNSALIRPLMQRTQYAVEVQFNGVPRWLQLDTGSADTWMITEDFTCLDSSLNAVGRSQCRLGNPYTGSVDPIPNVHYFEQYGSVLAGNTVYGTFGYADVTVAGITVKHQQVALVSEAVFDGGNLLSGLIGVAGRLNTNEYPGTKLGNSTSDKIMNYSPIFESMYNRTKQIQPMFSLALQRGKNGGYLTFGGLPPVDFDHDFASSKFVAQPVAGTPSPKKFYPIQPQGYELAGEYHDTSYISIVDSGTSQNLLPKEMADKVNAAFDPPAKYIASQVIYVVNCNATVPDFAIKIGGKKFHIDRRDMILELSGKCFSTISRGVAPNKLFPKGFYILGDAFLRNVVAVFDVGHGEMRFASHTSYTSYM